MLNGLISAFRFLTAIPIPFKKNAPFVPKAAVPFFPVAGLVIGLILALLDRFFLWGFTPVIAAALDVLLLICLTGALHMDGLADSGDGLFSHKPTAKILEIMKDSRIGSMGMVTVAAVLLIKFAALTGITQHRFIMLLLIPAFARAGLVFAMAYLPYLRKEDGLAGPFFVARLPVIFIIFLALMFTAAGLTGPRGWILIAGFAVSTPLLMLFYYKRMGGVTGDMLGAMIEAQEAFLLLLAAITLR